MLVLVRKPGQQLAVGDDITVTVLEVSGDRVKLGVEAPRHIRVTRPEATAELAAENRLAASGRRPALRLVKRSDDA